MRRAWRGLIWASPGQVDAGLSSLATFGAGIFAVSQLTVDQLGAYSLLFAAMQLAIQIPTELVLIPAQVLAVDHPSDVRLGMLRHSLPKGTLLALFSAALVPLGVIPVLSVLSVGGLVPLALTAAALSWLSPIQDHLRSMFHLSSKSWIAAAMSATHLVVTAGGLVVLGRSLPLWSPFGSLLLGNAVSMLVAGLMVRRIAPEPCPKPSRREISSVGSWLLATGISKTGAGYLTRALLNAFVGTAALGFVEAARIVAQPINVLALGLMAQVGPRLTEASAKRSAGTVKTWRTRFVVLLSVVALPYIILAAQPWSLNPLAYLTPRAYEVAGLTAAMLVAVTVACLLRPLRAELLGVRMQRVITQVTIATSLIEILVILAGFGLGPFVVPVGVLLSALAGILILTRRMRSVFVQETVSRAESLSPLR